MQFNYSKYYYDYIYTGGLTDKNLAITIGPLPTLIQLLVIPKNNTQQRIASQERCPPPRNPFAWTWNCFLPVEPTCNRLTIGVLKTKEKSPPCRMPKKTWFDLRFFAFGLVTRMLFVQPVEHDPNPNLPCIWSALKLVSSRKLASKLGKYTQWFWLFCKKKTPQKFFYITAFEQATVLGAKITQALYPWVPILRLKSCCQDTLDGQAERQKTQKISRCLLIIWQIWRRKLLIEYYIGVLTNLLTTSDKNISSFLDFYSEKIELDF